MKRVSYGRMHAVLMLLFGLLGLASTEIFADECMSYWTAEYKCMQGCGPCPGAGANRSGGASYDNGAVQRAQAAAEAERQRQLTAEAERKERERLAEEARKKAQRDAEFIRDRDNASHLLKGSSGPAMSQLKGLSGEENSGLKNGGFDSHRQLKGAPVVDDRNEPKGLGAKSIRKGDAEVSAKHVPISDDAMVVDARNVASGLDKATENAIAKAYPNVPAGVTDRVRKGFQAVMDHDWKVAEAWFQDALNRDPHNPGLKRLVVLAGYSREHVERGMSGKPFTDEDIPEDADPQTYAMTSTKIHSHEAWMKFLFPDGTHLRKSKQVHATTKISGQVILPEASDIKFLFDEGSISPPSKSKKIK